MSFQASPLVSPLYTFLVMLSNSMSWKINTKALHKASITREKVCNKLKFGSSKLKVLIIYQTVLTMSAFSSRSRIKK